MDIVYGTIPDLSIGLLFSRGNKSAGQTNVIDHYKLVVVKE